MVKKLKPGKYLQHDYLPLFGFDRHSKNYNYEGFLRLQDAPHRDDHDDAHVHDDDAQ